MRRNTKTMWVGVRRLCGACVNVFVCGVLAWVTPAHAAVQAFTYTGALTNPDGTQITADGVACVREHATDTCDFRVRLYTAATGGTLVWEDVVHNVELGDTGGAFTLTLDCDGDFAACSKGDGPNFATDALFIDVAFDPSGNADFAEGETFTPRTQMTAAAYAFHAQDAAQFQGLELDAFVRTDADSTIADDATLHINGDLKSSGDVTFTDTQIALDGSVTDLAVKGDFSINNDDLFIQKATGLIGIGTRAPLGAVHVTTPQDIAALYVDGAHPGPSTAPALAVHVNDATDTFAQFTQGVELFPRLAISAQGVVRLGSGLAAPDTQLYRSDTQTLKTDAAFVVGGNLGIGVDAPADPISVANGARLTAGGTWTNASDERLKENFMTVDGADILEKLAHLRITRWNYKREDANVTHIGPTAQDFFAAFGLGGSDTSISTIDPAGVAIVGVQELYARDKERAAALEDVRRELRKLREDVADDVQARVARSDDDTDRKIAQLEAEVAQLREYYAALADAYATLDPEQFAAALLAQEDAVSGAQTPTPKPETEMSAESADQEQGDDAQSAVGNNEPRDAAVQGVTAEAPGDASVPVVRGESIAQGTVTVTVPEGATHAQVFVPEAGIAEGERITLGSDDDSITLRVGEVRAGEGFAILLENAASGTYDVQWSYEE